MKRFFLFTAAVTCAFGLFGCGDKKGGGPAPAANVEEALARLGVDIDAGPRIDEQGDALPDDFAPAGPKQVFSRVDELMLVGMTAEDPNAPGNYLPGNLAWLEDTDGVTTLLDVPGTEPAWVDDTAAAAGQQAARAVIGADVDADGIEETVAAYLATNAASGDLEVNVAIYQDATDTAAFSETTTAIYTDNNLVDLRLTAADFDGDADDDLVLGLSDGTQFTFLFVVNDNGELSVNTAATWSVAPLNASNDWLSTSLTRANLDHDGGDEIVATLIEYQGSPSATGVARYIIFDDASHDFEVLDSDYVTGFGAGMLHAAVTSDVAAGDIDGDGLDEIVLGGLTNYNSSCTAIGTVYVALDDAVHGFNRIGEGYQEEFWNNCPANSPWRHRWAHVKLADLDHDQVPEVLVDRWIFEDWTEADPFTQIAAIPQTAFLQQVDSTGFIDRSTTAMAAGDFTGDNFAEIALYAENRTEISFWGLNGGNFEQTGGHPVQFQNAQTKTNPVLLPVNLDNDSTMLSWDRDYKLIFTEPIVLAALAAPPCFSGVGQNTDACTTTYGNADTTTTDTSLVLSQTVKVFAGFEAQSDLTQSKLKLKGTLERKLSLSLGNSYSVTQSIAYTTGPEEDSVIFTTIPYDQYTYTILTSPDPDLVGQQVVVSMPREQITLMAERTFYNESVTEDAIKIGPSIFNHKIGDPRSYPTTSDRDGTLGTFGGLSTQTATVGQGAGSTEVGLAVGKAYSVGGSLELGFEFEMECTGATILGGFSVGASVEAGLQVTSGTETTYTGSVGSIPAENYGEDRIYNFGLFTYPYEDEAAGQQFEVINYWVE